MAIVPTYIADPSGQQWLLSASDDGTEITTTPVSGQVTVPFITLNDASTAQTWRMVIVGPGPDWGQADITAIAPSSNPTNLLVASPNGTPFSISIINGELDLAPAVIDQPFLHVEQVAQDNYPTQLLVTAPNGTVYIIQIATVVPPQVDAPAQGILQTALAAATEIPTCDTPLSTLADNVQDRLEEPRGPGIFWRRDFEIYTELAEAMNDLLMLVGRPTQTVNVPFTLQPNTVWQRVPKGVFLISDIWGPRSQIRKVTLFDLDYSLSSWGPDWENDTDDEGPSRWAPIGMTTFAVHPAPTTPQSVTLDGIAYPVTASTFPYTGAELVPFHHEIFSALEEYAAHIARLKEAGPEFQESLTLYQNYLTMASRLTEMEDRRDPMIFARAFGAPAGVQSRVKR